MCKKSLFISVAGLYLLVRSSKSKLLYHPSKEVPMDGELFNGISYKLRSNGSDTVILFSHGNAGCISMRNYIDITDNDILIYDYYGFGASSGDVSTQNCIRSAYEMYKFLLQRYPKIILWGESIGSGVNAELYKLICKNNLKKPICIVSQEGFDSLKNVSCDVINNVLGNNIFSSIGACLLSPIVNEYDSNKIYLEYLTKDIPMVIAHSSEDKLINLERASNLYESLWKAGKKVIFVPTAGGHCDFFSYRENVRSVIGTIKSMVEHEGKIESLDILN